jgi:CubicO group peptidase (beta-lactamase class C family)
MFSSPARFVFDHRVRTLRTGLTWTLAAVAATTSLPAQKFSAVDAAIRAGIDTGIFPGAVVVVGRADTILYASGYGHYTWSTTSPAPDPANTRWDLASLTKIVATSSATAVLVQQHKLDLDAPVQHYLPEFSGGRKSEVTVRMLLNHTSGMPPYAKLWQSARSVAEARKQLFAIPLQRAPGASADYSDLNAMLAGLIVERVSGEPLERFAETAFFRPLGMVSDRKSVV